MHLTFFKSTEMFIAKSRDHTWKMANMMQLRGLLLENSATWKILRPHLFKSFSSCKDKVNKIVTNPLDKGGGGGGLGVGKVWS